MIQRSKIYVLFELLLKLKMKTKLNFLFPLFEFMILEIFLKNQNNTTTNNKLSICCIFLRAGSIRFLKKNYNHALGFFGPI